MAQATIGRFLELRLEKSHSRFITFHDGEFFVQKLASVKFRR
jgi:hypothetical protein